MSQFFKPNRKNVGIRPPDEMEKPADSASLKFRIEFCEHDLPLVQKHMDVLCAKFGVKFLEAVSKDENSTLKSSCTFEVLRNPKEKSSSSDVSKIKQNTQVR